ncbi:aminotransferase class III-fold pyridoxal phosphate-dependent enzyme, partial [Campylobacter coli]|nr:aminotransferase class III-fold pyridoxal phosphate-dependent enzyme [Campylobacter coli]
MQNQILKNLDLKHIWHPCTQMKDHETLPLIPIKKAKGVWLYDFDDKAYMDCVSSWWVNLFGHCNEKITNAIKKQVDELEHVILAGFTHEPIIKLSARLCEKVGRNFNKCFYADNGSSAIE